MSLTAGQLAWALGALAVLYGISKAWPFVRLRFTTPLRNLRGPPSDSLLWGNLRRIIKAENSVIHEQWNKEYGTTFAYSIFFGSLRLYTVDTRALSHILNNSQIWQKPGMVRRALAEILGEGVLFTEGEQHKRQRRIMNPAFGNAQLREHTNIFLEKSAQLRDIWMAKTTEGGGSATLDALSWLSRATLDIIGLAGFDYQFNALNEKGESNELSDAFTKVFATGQSPSTLLMLRNIFPFLRWVPEKRQRDTRAARATMDRIGMELINEKKRAIRAGDAKSTGKDLLTLLIQANMDKDIPAHLRMTDAEVLGQVPTFLIAGHETTATSTTWCMYAMSLHPEVQTKLRAELLAVPSEHPTMDELNGIPYLDAVVRETLRVHAVVSSTVRVAAEDDMVPVGTPYVDRKGRTQHEIRVKKGDTVFLPILALNRAPDIWGEDAHLFRPERWNTIPEAAKAIPGVLLGLESFIGGPRSCIGYRFALLEMKALLFHLVRAFEVQLAVPAEQIASRSQIVARPLLKTDNTNQLPIKITPVH